MKAAYLMDTVGNKHAQAEIAMIKVLAPNVTQQVLDWAIQAHGAGGVSGDFPLAAQWAGNRTLRLADGPMKFTAMRLRNWNWRNTLI
jgi:acyl-CoA dehydrogenase